jgi:hypothetical protein
MKMVRISKRRAFPISMPLLDLLSYNSLSVTRSHLLAALGDPSGIRRVSPARK